MTGEASRQPVRKRTLAGTGAAELPQSFVSGWSGSGSGRYCVVRRLRTARPTVTARTSTVAAVVAATAGDNHDPVASVSGSPDVPGSGAAPGVTRSVPMVKVVSQLRQCATASYGPGGSSGTMNASRPTSSGSPRSSPIAVSRESPGDVIASATSRGARKSARRRSVIMTIDASTVRPTTFAPGRAEGGSKRTEIAPDAASAPRTITIAVSITTATQALSNRATKPPYSRDRHRSHNHERLWRVETPPSPARQPARRTCAERRRGTSHSQTHNGTLLLQPALPRLLPQSSSRGSSHCRTTSGTPGR